ncbi:hypothetical protein CMV_022368 [Castanea mollissima]|uniref:Sigma factor n=1 Tax=Castanea mollissima TaxID=60419 RepID=A0A8J4QSZ6_9ROSI|nr:hypothetical protein CMV_022368 [Castanea mollissima]
MGFGFRLNLKWGFPIQSHSLTNSPSRLSSSYVRGKEASLNLTRQSFVSVISEESETFYKDPRKADTCSAPAPLFTENNFSEMEDMKKNIRKRSYSSLRNMIDDTQVPVEEDKFTSCTSLQGSKEANFNLLIENLHVLEETFVDSDVLRLERDILQQLGRLGAINLFNTCLSRTVQISNLLDLSDIPTDYTEHEKKSKIDEHAEDEMKGKTDDCIGKFIVRSGKKRERKSRREKTLENACESSLLLLPSKTIQQRFGQPNVSSVKRASSSRSRRLKISRNEAEMSTGVKVVANLERIRRTLEEETGRVATLRCWAEAAGLDEKVLQQNLLYGWYCRDEIIRSTRSLVLYLARNYRGLGIALEDLIQAGNLGVLQGAERFDHTRGYRFSTYVQYWIRKSMSRMVSQHARGIQIPYTLCSAINQIQKAKTALNSGHKKYPDDDEIAKHTGLSLAKIRSASKCLRVVGSIDQKIGHCINIKYMEFTPDMSVKSPEETVMRQHMIKDIHDLLRGLDSRERQALFLRYGLKDSQPKSLEESGRLLCVTKEWMRKIEKKALTKLRDEDICRNLSHYLDL